MALSELPPLDPPLNPSPALACIPGPRCEPLFRALSVALFFLLVVPCSLADTVYLRSGRAIEGEILKQTQNEIQVLSEGVRLAFPMAQVERFVYSGTDLASERNQEALALLRQGKAEEAWNKLRAIENAEPGAAARFQGTIASAADSLLAQANEAVRGTDPQLWKLTLDILAPLTQEDSQSLLQQGFPTHARDKLEQIRLLRGQAFLRLGIEDRKNSQILNAERNLQNAAEILRPGDSLYLENMYHLGAVQRSKADTLLMSDTSAAEESFRRALQSLALARDVRQRPDLVRYIDQEIEAARQGLQRIQDTRYVPPTPTPWRPRFTPTPMPTPTPEPNFVGRILGESAEATVDEIADKILPDSISTEAFLRWTGYVIAFIVGFWTIPWAVLKILARRADILASLWKGRVWWLGPLALLGYIGAFTINAIRNPRRKGADKVHQCPHCGFMLDNYMAYEDMNFARCPSCRREISPVQNLDDYIIHLANNLATDVERAVMGLVDMKALAEKDTMQRLVRALITNAVRHRASDLHIEPQQENVIIRQRVDGIMQEMVRLPGSLGAPLVSAIKVQAEMDISEKRRPQDGALQYWIDEADIDIRVASSPSHHGETISLRLLDIRSIQLKTKNLGMTKYTREIFERAIEDPHGLVLVTGPTGSGKTTTLYVALQHLTTGDKNIISIEDPIEFRIPGINQIQVNPAAGLSFASGLRSILRQDPDVIMVGEIRDTETAEIAVNAALTGHLVFTTLHTIDAASSVTRLIDLGVSPRQFSDALSLVVAQRLIRLICPECKRGAKPKKEILQDIGISPDQEKEFTFCQGRGCELCNHTGYYGRTGIFELLVPTEGFKALLERQNLTTSELRERAISQGMRTLREEAFILLRQGLTTPEEVLRVTK